MIKQLEQAIEKENIQEVLTLLRIGGLELRDPEGWTPLHFATRQGKLPIVQAILAYGQDVNAQTYEGKTPLYFAAICNMPQIAEYLVSQGADINIADNRGRTVLHACSCRGFVGAPMIKQLLDWGELSPVSFRLDDYVGYSEVANTYNEIIVGDVI